MEGGGSKNGGEGGTGGEEVKRKKGEGEKKLFNRLHQKILCDIMLSIMFEKEFLS